jgi:hypothetical protein
MRKKTTQAADRHAIVQRCAVVIEGDGMDQLVPGTARVKQTELALSLRQRFRIVYWTWWDLINTTILLLVVTGCLMAIALQLMESSAAGVARYVPAEARFDWGVKLLSVTLSAASASALWILSKCVKRWSVISRVRHIVETFLEELATVLRRAGSAVPGSTALTASAEQSIEFESMLEHFPWSFVVVGDNILLLHQNAQNYLDDSAKSSRLALAMARLSSNRRVGTEGEALLLAHLKTLYIQCCLALLYMNRTPKCDQVALVDSMAFVSRAGRTKLMTDCQLFKAAITQPLQA